MRTHQGVHGSAEKQRSRSKLIEEFLLDDGPFLSLGAQTPQVRMHKQTAKLRTVSIIDTLSELSPGELDKEDQYRPFIPGTQIRQTSARPCFRAVNGHCNTQELFLRDYQKPETNRKVLRKYDTCLTLKPTSRETVQQHRVGVVGSAPFSPVSSTKDLLPRHRYSTATDCPYLSDTGLPRRICVEKPLDCTTVPMSSASHSNAVSCNTGQKPRWQSTSTRPTEDSLRHCFSDSEIGASELLKMHGQSAPLKTMNKLKYKSDDCLDSDPSHALPSNKDWTVESWICSLGEPANQDLSKADVFPRRYRKKSKMPEWIRLIFKIAKQGNLEMLKTGMKDMDSALVRNLSDCNGNNLWHICSARNYLPCIQWLSNKFGHQALKDENKSSLTPCVLAVKHGCVSVVQWLLEHTSCQVFSPTEGSRSLLHYASKYGQGSVLTWLVDYMAKLNMDVNAKDSEGNTALHLAAKYGHVHCVKDLVLCGGDMTCCNELGLRPYDLAVFSQQSACAEYLISLETLLALATDHYLLEQDAQRYQAENSDVKRNFKDLLQSLKSSLRHQREMLDACKQIQAQWLQQHQVEHEQIGGEHLGESSHQTLLQKEEFERWFSSLILKDESVCQLIEDRWKRQSRKASRHSGSKREPLDILRSQFMQTQVKANSLTPLPDVSILSSSESECTDESMDESFCPQKETSPTLQRQTAVSYRQDAFPDEGVSIFSRNSKLVRSNKVVSLRSRKKGRLTSSSQTVVRPWSMQVPFQTDMDLRDLFERNPGLKQEGETCSVLEVLEPSSSENEELAQLERQYAVSVKESKSSNSLESESSSSTCSKTRARNSQDILALAKGRDSRGDARDCMLSPVKISPTVEPRKLVVRQANVICKSKGKDRSKLDETLKTSDSKCSPESTSRSSKGSPSTSSSDSKSLESESRIEADSVSIHNSPNDCVEIGSPESSPELAVSSQSSVIKKKGFLLKFSLKNRWSSKQKQRSTKKLNESVAEEAKDVKSETTTGMETVPSSQPDSLVENHETGSLEDTVVVEIHNATNIQQQLQPKKVERFLPPPPPPPPNTRRDPPPMPPTESKQYPNSPSQLDCPTNLLPDILSSNTLEETPTEHSSQTEQSGQSSNEQFCSSSDVSRLYCSTAKSDSRPPSSASRIDSTLRSEDGFKSIGFPLCKSSSASTEILLTPDLSAAGRQSPAPSEVSKTESALSPPSDVSKTESQRLATHLGKIEEMTVNAKNSAEVKVAAILDIGMECEGAEGQVTSFMCQEAEGTQEFIQKKTVKESSNKPWYEMSDDEDILSPGRSLGNQSNSEDESNSLLR